MAFSLTAFLGLNTTKFERGLNNARTKLNSSVKSMLTSLGPLVGFVGFSVLARGALESAREITNLSKVANALPDIFQKNAFAAKTVGVEQEKLADIYKDTNDKIGDFLQSGAGPMVDFFENIGPKVGVTADMFKKLSGPEALQLYYTSIEKSNLSQAEMTFYMEAIASDAALLIPLLKDGGKGFADLGQQAEDAGLIMDKGMIKKLERINLKMDIWKKKGEIVVGTIVSKLVPAIQILTNGLGFVGDVTGSAAAIALELGKSWIEVIKIAISPAITGIKGLSLAIKAMGQAAVGNFAAAAESIALAKEALGEAVDKAKSAPDDLKAVGVNISNAMKSGFETLGDSVETRSKQITSALDDITGKSKEAEDALADAMIESQKGSSSPDGSGSGTGEGRGAILEAEQKLRKMKLEALKAEVRGEKELAETMQRRIKLAEDILRIMRETGATQKEATIIANSRSRADGSTRLRDPSSDEARREDARGKITTGKIGESNSSAFGAMPTMEERERAAGLFLAGNDTMSGRRAPEDLSKVPTRSKEESLAEAMDPATKELVEIKNSIKGVETELTSEK